MLSAKNIFQKNDFIEISLRQKLFYVETNGVLVIALVNYWLMVCFPSLSVLAFLSS
jgi:hypothetical protein